jgi:hypothetical protein
VDTEAISGPKRPIHLGNGIASKAKNILNVLIVSAVCRVATSVSACSVFNA